MLLSVFEKYLFLQSLGWGIANSLWQAGLLWLIYKLVIAGNKNIAALFKYQLSILLLFLSFAWFISTTIQNYLSAEHSGNSFTVTGWIYTSSNIHIALQWLSVLYLSLLLLHSFQFTKRFAGLYVIRNRQLIKAPVNSRVFTEQTALHIGIKRKVAIWLSENVEVPSVTGFFKPIILLPVAVLNQLTTTQAESIILHELAHIKRNDYLVNLLQSFAELILFFNPFARLLGNAARQERENCCDDWVLNYQYNKHDYAAALLLLEKQRTQGISLALAATNGRKDLLGRIKRLFAAEPRTNINFLQQLKLAFVSLLIIALMFFILPTISRQAAPEQTNLKKRTILPMPVTVKTTSSIKESKVEKFITVQPVQVTVMTGKIKAPVKHAKAKTDELIEYSTAWVNEELLDGASRRENIPLLAAKPLTSYPKLFVQVEEEKSGVQGKNTYVLQLNNNNGYPEIKPLIILNKKMKNLSGKLRSAHKEQPAGSISVQGKRRITS